MKRLLWVAALGSAACGAASADAPPKEAPKAAGEHYDVVYFADARPVLLRLHVSLDGRPLSAAWDGHVTRVFRYLDADGDGVLDKGEVGRVPSPDALFGAGTGTPAPTMTDLDAGGDGKVTRDELAAYFRRVGAAPFQLPGGGRRNEWDAMYLQQVLFAERLAEVELALFEADGRLVGRAAGPEDINEALFKLLDTDGDGKLSKGELAAAPAVLQKRDRSDDEIITPDEITSAARGGAEYQYAVTKLRFLEVHGGMRGGANGPFWLAAPGASKAELARRLQERYAKSAAKDKPAPTKLSRNDLRLDEAAFAKLDVDGDGALDTEELARFAQRPPDLELKIDLGGKASVELVKRGGALEASVRPGKGGVLMLEMDGTRLDLAGLAAEKVDAAKVAQQEREGYQKALKEADRDNNGYLDAGESMRSPLYRNVFKLMDRDGDGMLYEKEVFAYLDVYQELQATARACCATVGITSEGKGLFEMLDTDGDRRLSVREARGAAQLIADLDRDGDRVLARGEIPRCSQATFRTGPAGAERYNANYKAVSLKGGVRQPGQPAKPPRGPEWFRKMDRNGDGDLSRKEFLGTDAQFKETDADGDGLVSVEEAEAHDKKLREQREKE